MENVKLPEAVVGVTFTLSYSSLKSFIKTELKVCLSLLLQSVEREKSRSFRILNYQCPTISPFYDVNFLYVKFFLTVRFAILLM